MTQPSLSYHVGIRQETNSGESYKCTISLPIGFQLVCSCIIGFDLTLTDETLWIGLEQKIWHWCNSHRRESLANNISSHSRRHLRMFPRDLTQILLHLALADQGFAAPSCPSQPCQRLLPCGRVNRGEHMTYLKGLDHSNGLTRYHPSDSCSSFSSQCQRVPPAQLTKRSCLQQHGKSEC